MSGYRQEANSDARETVSQYKDEILEKLQETGEASEDLYNDYPNGDSWHHECHVDKWYSLTDAADLINELSDHEETDSGLWEGQQPKEAIGTCAAFTYGNTVYSEWRDLIKEINCDAGTIIDDFSDQIDDAEEDDEDYEGESADDLRELRTTALGELLDRIIAGN